MSVAEQQLWGGETAKAVENFPVSGERVPVSVVRWLAAIKGAAARVNADLGKLDPELAERIAAGGRRDRRRRARRPVPDRRLPDRLGHVDEHERQRGHREPRRRGRAPQRPREHGPVLQRRVPERRPPRRARRGDEPPAAGARATLEAAFAAKAAEFEDVVKAGRTHLMDAVPVTLGQEFAGYAAQMRLGARRVRNALPQVAQIPLGGTAVGNGLNTHPEFAESIRALLSEASGLDDLAARGPVRGAGQPRRARRAVGRAEGRRRLADEDRAGPRADGLRPARRDRRDLPARAAEGLVDHAREGQPGHPRGRHAGRRAGHRQRHGDHRSAACRATSSSTCASRSSRATCCGSIHLLSTTSQLFADECVAGIEANLDGCERSSESTLAAATALNPYIGYDKGAAIVKEAASSGRMLREVALEHGVDEATYDEAMDLRKMARGCGRLSRDRT